MSLPAQNNVPPAAEQLLRCIALPLQNNYYAAETTAVHPEDKMVECRSADGIRFFVEYDVLAIATGSQVGGGSIPLQGSTLGIPRLAPQPPAPAPQTHSPMHML